MVGARIKAYLQSKGIKQIWLTEKTGLTKDAVSDIVNNDRRIEVTEYVRICMALGVPLETFVKEEMAAGEEEVNE